MYFYQDLYVSSKIEHPGRIKWRLRHNAGQFSVYLILLCQKESKNQLEIINSAFLQQPFYKKNRPFILGMAVGRSDAMELITEMIQEAYEHTGTADVRAYLFPEGVVTKGGSFRAGKSKKDSGVTARETKSDRADAQKRG